MNCSLEAAEEINYNSKMFTFKLPGASHMVIPTGHHIRIKAKSQNGMIMYRQGKFYACCTRVLMQKLFHMLLM